MRSTIRIAVALLGLYGASRLASRRRALPFDGVVFVTGGSRGLGFAIAREFMRRGARVAIAGRDATRLERAQEALTDGNRVPLAIQCDVRDATSVRRAIECLISSFGRIDVVVNNAGIISVGPWNTMKRADYEDALATHFWGPYNVIESALPYFRAGGGGRIVNVASVGGRVSFPRLLPYNASKFALTGYSEGLRAETAGTNISVTTVCPGLMRTGSPRNALFKGHNRKEYAWFVLADTLPGISVPATTAARRIVNAAIRRDADVEIGITARAGALVHGIAPGLTAKMLSAVSRILPRASDGQAEPRRGYQSESGVTASPLTTLGRNAERKFNQR